MASFADIIVGKGMKDSAPAQLDILGSIEKGASLAHQREQTQALRQQMEQKQQELQLQKLEKVSDWFKTASAMEDGGPKKAFTSNFIPNGITALGLGDAFNPTSLKMFTDNPLVVEFASDKIRRGEMQLDDILGAMANPEKAAKLFASPDFRQFGAAEENKDALQDSLGRLRKASEFASSEEGKASRAAMLSQQRSALTQQAPVLEGKKAVARNVGEQYAAYEAEGGKAASKAALQKLREASGALRSGKVKTGDLSTRIPGLSSEMAQATLNPGMVAMKSQAQAALNSVLRQTLGSQFTQNEGERVLNQIWDDKLSPAANAKKIDAKVKELEANIASKEEQFVRQGFMPASEKTALPQKINGDSVLVDGRRYNRAKIEQLLQANPNDPAAQKFREALGVK